jgi:putative tricarboxylic transport membrane protein
MVDAAPAPEPRRVVGLLAGLVFVAWALDVLGYQLTMVIFLVFLMKVIDRASWRLTLLVAVLAGPGIYHLFADLLAVQLPLSNLPALQHSGL